MTQRPPGHLHASDRKRRGRHLLQQIARLGEYGLKGSAERLARRVVRYGKSWLPCRRATLTDAEFFSRCSSARASWNWFADPTRPLPLPAFGDPDRLRRLLLSRCPDAGENTVAEADRILGGSLKILGFEFMQNGWIQWDLDPWSGTRFPCRHRLRLGIDQLADRGDRSVDFMFGNEVNKHTGLLTLGKAYFLTGDERYAEAATKHLVHWLDRNPIGSGIPYYSTLTVAQRIMTWVFLWATLRGSVVFRERGLRILVTSLCLQAEFLEANLSAHWNPRNNFYLTELTALALAGAAVPELARAGTWLKDSMALFEEELPRQVWPDGVSIEQSVGYQRLVLDVTFIMLLLRGVPGASALDAVMRAAEGLAESHMHLLEPSGMLSGIGDVSTERAVVLDDGREFHDGRPTLSTAATLFQRPDMKWTAGRFYQESAWLLGPDGAERFDGLAAMPPADSSRAFPSGGYYVMRSGWEAGANQMVVDAGWTGMGPTGPGGHGHNDALSFSLAVGGKPVLVDSGTYTYLGSRAWRDWFRSTAAHNTVMVDGEEMALLGPGLFQISRQPVPRVLEWRSMPEEDLLIAEHTGYHRLADPVTHRRTIRFQKPDSWVIQDDCLGSAAHRCEVLFHCAPGVSVEVGKDEAVLTGPEGPRLGLLFSSPPGLTLRIQEGWVSRQYGQKVQAPVLVAAWHGPLPVRIVSALVTLDGRNVAGWRERAHALVLSESERAERLSRAGMGAGVQ